MFAMTIVNRTSSPGFGWTGAQVTDFTIRSGRWLGVRAMISVAAESSPLAPTARPADLNPGPGPGGEGSSALLGAVVQAPGGRQGLFALGLFDRS